MKIELGSFQKREGWTTVDLDPRADICQDLNSPLSNFKDNSIDQIYSSHLLEHFYYPDMKKLLLECLRILKPNGAFEAAVPNMRPYIEAYLRPSIDFVFPNKIYQPAFHYFSKIDLINYMGSLDGIHRWMFDEDNLPLIISEVGFRNVKLREFKEGLDLFERREESIYVEAVK
jgi:predicted SAM-dependent methyltransferase